MSYNPKAKVAHIRYAVAGAGAAEAAWCPRADIYRTRDGWIVKFELAGVPPDDLHVYAHSRRLTVSGVRRDTVAEHGCSHYMMEISYNRFERSVELPCEISAENLDIELRNGILLVRVTSKGE